MKILHLTLQLSNKNYMTSILDSSDGAEREDFIMKSETEKKFILKIIEIILWDQSEET